VKVPVDTPVNHFRFLLFRTCILFVVFLFAFCSSCFFHFPYTFFFLVTFFFSFFPVFFLVFSFSVFLLLLSFFFFVLFADLDCRSPSLFSVSPNKQTNGTFVSSIAVVEFVIVDVDDIVVVVDVVVIGVGVVDDVVGVCC